MTRVVLFACVQNAGRSQMAAALLNQFADPSKARAISAGTEPGDRVHPEVVAAMREVGIDLSLAQPQRLTDDLARSATLLVTMGCGEACPVVPGVQREDWPLPDPKGQPLDGVRQIRDQIGSRVRELIAVHDWFPFVIRRARPEDRAQVDSLLRAAELSLEGVVEHFNEFLVATDGASTVLGVVGLEIHAESALLRSLAVASSVRGRGIGSALTSHALAAARVHGAGAVYLLTLTAADFFAKHGFERIERTHAPAAIAASDEFARLCPQSAILMRRRTPALADDRALR